MDSTDFVLESQPVTARPTSLSATQLQGITTCHICQETFQDPRSLPCLHTFCLSCICTWCSTTMSEENPLCPQCGVYFSLPEGGQLALPKNIFLNQLLELMAFSASASHVVMAANHESEAVSSIDRGRYDMVTRKLHVFTVATARHFARKLFTYIRLNDFASTKTLMENINVTDREAVMRELSDEGSSPLFEAVQRGRLQFVEYFLKECNADTEQRCFWHERKNMSYFQVSPLWLAAHRNRLAIAKCLVDHGAQINAQSISQPSVVRTACLAQRNESRIDLVRYLVEKGADIITPNTLGYCCIHNAASSAELSRYLIERGADVNAVSTDGQTALYAAVEAGRLDVVKELISLGAHSDICDEDGVDALQLAIIRNRDDIATFLSSHTSMGNGLRADIFALRGVRCVDRKKYGDAAANWRLAVLQSVRKDVFTHKLMLYTRNYETLKNSDVWGMIHQLTTETDDCSRYAQLQIFFCDKFLQPCHPEAIENLRYLAAVYADNENYQLSVEALLSALHRCRSRSLAFRPKAFADVLQLFCDISLHFHRKKSAVRFSDVAEAFTLTVHEFVETLKLPLLRITFPGLLTQIKLAIMLIYLMLKTANGTTDEMTLMQLVKSLVQLEPRAADGRGLLHVAIDPSIAYMLSDFSTVSPNVPVIEKLLECGTAVNCTDNEGNTPFDYVLNFKSHLISVELASRLRDQFIEFGSVTHINCW